MNSATEYNPLPYPPKHWTDADRCHVALGHLNAARELLKAAGARKTLARVRRAISSAKGARRNADQTRTYQLVAESWEGKLWRPHFVVSREADGHHWQDLASTDRAWTGPFPSERAAWKDICSTYGLIGGTP